MKIWLLSDFDNRKHQTFRSLVYRFLSTSTDMKIEFFVKSRKSMWESLFAHLRDPRHNPMADIVEIPQNWTELFNRLGMLADLKPHLESLQKNLYPEPILAELCRHSRNNIYSVPWWQESPALFYRPQAIKTICKNPKDELASWNGFRKVLDTLAAHKKKIKYSRTLSVPGSSGAVSVTEVLPRVWGRRGGLFSEDFTRAAFTREETFGGIQDCLNLVLSGHVELFSQDRFENGFRPDEECAFVLSSRKITCSGRLMEMLPYPGCANGGGLLLVHNLAVSSSSPVQRDAAAFIAWLSEQRNAITFSEGFGVFPCLSAAFEEKLQRDRNADVYRHIFSAPELMPNIMAYPTAELLLERALWNLSLKIARGDYSKEDLTRELIMAQGEADYLLSLY